MGVATFNTLYQGMHRILAKDMLTSFTVADYPNVAQKEKRNLHRKVYKIAHPNNFKDKVVTTKDLELI